MKKDLKDCTFIIPVRIESEDRLRNVITILCYIISNFDTNIIMKEVDKKPVFKDYGLSQVEEYCENISCFNYIFEESDDPIFLREKMLNEMLAITKTKVVVNSGYCSSTLYIACFCVTIASCAANCVTNKWTNICVCFLFDSRSIYSVADPHICAFSS